MPQRALSMQDITAHIADKLASLKMEKNKYRVTIATNAPIPLESGNNISGERYEDVICVSFAQAVLSANDILREHLNEYGLDTWRIVSIVEIERNVKTT